MSWIFLVVLTSLLVCLDQLIKFLVVTYLKPVATVTVLKGILNFTYVENTGAVFGSFAAHTVILTLVSLLLVAITVYIILSEKVKSKLINTCLILMISGGIGNVIDRIRLHYVVDFIEPAFVRFAVFNFADCLITVGAFVIVGYILYDMIKNGNKEKKAENSQDGTVKDK